MATAEQYVAKAASYIGVSGTDNIFNTWYWGRHVYDAGSYPWCAAFQSYIGVHDLGMPFSASASAAGVANQGRRVDDADAKPGDWVLFNWDGRQDFSWADHIGVVEWTDIGGSGYFGTIEGNTGNTAGGEVARCARYNFGSYATAFFRPPYSQSQGGATTVANKGVIQLHSLNGDKAQKWTAIKSGEYFKLKNASSGWMLDVADAKTKAGTKIQAWKPNGSDAQLFKFVPVQTGKMGAQAYEIVPKIAPKMRLDVKDALTGDGETVIQLHPSNGSAAQRWCVIVNSGGKITIVSQLAHHPALEVKDGK